MTIHIEDLKFQCIIGILDFERNTPQDVIINLSIDYTYKEAFINYADVVKIVKSDLIESKYLLIEDALEELSAKLKEKFFRIDTLNLKITKPSILEGCTVSVSNCYSFNS
jgi:7,8-dihydroneopterin aldolase/epimerase/oxygenase